MVCLFLSRLKKMFVSFKFTQRGTKHSPDQLSFFEVSFFSQLFDAEDLQLFDDVLSEHVHCLRQH